MANICVFCGSRGGSDSAYVQAARDLGCVIAERGDQLVYGGGSTGMMGAIADAVLQRAGNIIGVIPEALASVELMHYGVTDMRIVSDMHTRKATMHSLAEAYIALPGGYGTMEELFEVLCWAQLDFHNAPVAVLNLHGYYDGLNDLIETMVREEFLGTSFQNLLSIVSTVEQLKHWLNSHF